MITIENLEIQLDIEGDDEKEFARLFNEFIRRWADQAKAQKESEDEARRAGSLLDQAETSEPW